MNKIRFDFQCVNHRYEGVLFHIAETQFVVPVYAYKIIRIPVAAFDPPAADIVAAAHGKAIVGSVFKISLLYPCYKFIA